GIPAGSKSEREWLVDKRNWLCELRIKLLVRALELAERHPGKLPYAEYRHTLTALAPDHVLPAGVMPPAQRISPSERISNIETLDVPHPTGREDELRRLRERFEEGVRLQVVWGEAGIGKSVLALAYARRHASEYRVVWRIDAETD